MPETNNMKWSERWRQMDFLMFQLNKDSKIPLYEQLYKGIKDAIINGTIEEGSKLPSKRKVSRLFSN